MTRAEDDRFATFDFVLKQHGRGRWKWSVRAADGRVIMRGSELSRGGARYRAERALFLLLCASASRAPKLLPPDRSELAAHSPAQEGFSIKASGSSKIRERKAGNGA